MSKYAPIEEHLSKQTEDHATLTYQEMEKLVGFELPSSAYKHRAWWSNGKKGGSKFWLRVGWQVDFVKLGDHVTFRRAETQVIREEAVPASLEQEEYGEVIISLDLADVPAMIKSLQSLMVDGIISREMFEEKKTNLLSLF